MIVFLCLLLVAAFPASADPRPPDPAVRDSIPHAVLVVRDSIPRAVLTVPEVVVPGVRPDAAASLAPTGAVATRTLRAAAGADRALTEVLGSIAGLHVTDYGGLGDFSTVSMRGLPSNHVALLVDGVPLGTASGGTFNLAALPASAIERVEAWRGESPLLLGVSAPAGAINLVTLAAPHVQEFRLERGSWQTWDARGAVGVEHGRFAAELLADGFTTRGNFVYRDRNGTDLDPSDDGDSVRVNDRRDLWTALASGRWRGPGGWSATAREIFHHRALGLPGTGAVPAATPRLVEEWSRPMLELARSSTGRLPAARFTAASEEHTLHFIYTQGQLAGSPFDTDDHLRGESVALALERPARPWWIVPQAQVSLRRDRADVRNARSGFPAPPESRRWTRGATVDLEVHPYGDRVLLHVAKRWERDEDHLRASGFGTTIVATNLVRELVTPQAGVRVRLLRGLEARANWSEADRAPDFLELFGNEGAVQGNPALKPEHVISRDAGLAWQGRAGPVAIDLEGWRFANEATDLILLIRNSQSTLKATNVSRMENRGEEASAGVRLPGGVALAGAGTWQAARDRGPVLAWRGRKIPLRPDRELHLDASWTHAWIALATSVHDIDPNFTDRRNQTLVPRRTLVGLAATVAPPRSPVRYSIDLKNLTDDRGYDLGGYPLPGRMVAVTLEWRLGRDSGELR